MTKKENLGVRKGKVVSAFGNQITWICVTGDECQHTLTDDAKITLNGKPCKLDDLRVGMPIRVTECAEDASKTTFVSAAKIQSIPYT